MNKYIGSVLSAFFLTAFFAAAGADLTLKNGQIYKNYRIKNVQNNKVLIAFMANDGSPDIAEINIAELPPEVAGALGGTGQTPDQTANAADNTPENVTAEVAAKLKNDLALLPADDVNGKRQLIIKAGDMLKKALAAFYSDAEFETIWNGSDGIIAKVIRINRSGFLKVNDKVFIRSTSQLGNRFRAGVYAVGCLMQFGSNEMLQVLTLDEKSAVQFALDNILSVNGTKPSDEAAESKDVPAPVQTNAVPATAPVVNNYYFYDDNDDDVVYVLRDGRRYILPYRRRGKRPVVRPSNKPVVRPENRPGNRPAVHPENRPGNRPGNPPQSRPPVKDKFSKNKSVIQRNDKKIHSYDHLPEWALPRSSRP